MAGLLFAAQPCNDWRRLSPGAYIQGIRLVGRPEAGLVSRRWLPIGAAPEAGGGAGAAALAVLAIVTCGTWGCGVRRPMPGLLRTRESCRGLPSLAPCRRHLAAWRNQCRQLIRLLEGEGSRVELVQDERALPPHLSARIPLVPGRFPAAAFSRCGGRPAETASSIFANSGWAWHLCAAPAIVIAHLRRLFGNRQLPGRPDGRIPRLAASLCGHSAAVSRGPGDPIRS